MALFGIDFSGIFSAIKSWLGPFGKLFDSIGSGVSHAADLRQRVNDLIAEIVDEVNAWKNFKQDIRFKQRVINLESAIDKTRALIQGIPDSWNAIKDLWKETAGKFKEISGGEDVAAEAEGVITDAEESGAKGLVRLFPKLAKVGEKALGIVAVIVGAIEQASNIVDDIKTIVDELKRLRLEIEKLDTIFLSQSNKRKILKLADGSTIKVRLGKLHA